MNIECERCGTSCCKELLGKYFRYRDDRYRDYATDPNETSELNMLQERGFVSFFFPHDDENWRDYNLTISGKRLLGAGYKPAPIQKPQEYTTPAWTEDDERRWESNRSW